MSDDIYQIIKRLSAIESRAPVQESLDRQQRSVPELPALFRAKNISPVLGSKKDPQHPTAGYMVGDSKSPKKSQIEETMKEIDEDMLGKVRKDLNDYLDQLTAQKNVSGELKAKAKDAIQKDPVEEDPVEEDSAAADQATIGTPVKTVSFEDGKMCEIHGDEKRGFEIRSGKRRLPTKFADLDHALTAVDMFRTRRAAQRPTGTQDYMDEA